MKCTNLIEFSLVFVKEWQASYKPAAGSQLIDGQQRRIVLENMLPEYISKLRKLAVSLESLNLQDCNYGLTTRQQTRKDNIQVELATICENYGITAITQGDPRGAAFGILCKHTGKYNSWDGAESGFRLMFEGK